MLNIKVRLSKDVHDILTMFGPLDDVANRVLQAIPDCIDMPNYDKGVAKTPYHIVINNDDYEALYKLYGPNSPRISLSRILSTFVYEEMYVELGWQPLKRPQPKATLYSNRDQCILLLQRMSKKATEQQQNIISKIYKLLTEL